MAVFEEDSDGLHFPHKFYNFGLNLMHWSGRFLEIRPLVLLIFSLL